MMVRSLTVAVIGAGVAGLLAARELQREGHRVVVYEKSSKLGGLWAYDPRVESDELGLDPGREIVHGSIYLSLRTNLPRELMSFSDFRLTEREYGDPRTFPGHKEVLSFLEDFAREFGLIELIRFKTEVVRVERVGRQWVVETIRADGESLDQAFEAVVVCNGHCTVPRLAEIPGLEKWRGKQTHSHNYRVPEPFRDQVIIVIGNGASAYDISRDISKVAKEVHLSSRSPNANLSKLDIFPNIWQHSEIACVNEDGTVAFEDGSLVHADTIFHCTGYNYEFRFLKTNGIVSVDDNRVGPLYNHVFPPELAPSLSFVGLPHQSILFALMELQSQWIARVLSGKVALPSKEEMTADVEQYFQQMKKLNRPTHHTHFLYKPEEFKYLDWLAAQAGSPLVEERKKEIYRKFLKLIENPHDRLRDEWTACGVLVARNYNTRLVRMADKACPFNAKRRGEAYRKNPNNVDIGNTGDNTPSLHS
ncbi:hypothetical protein Nepgr_002445 [Nepenthes gracilis]|uniref:Flavin-containing monooxygenase n=1 Tax=Nepenthes gracilis TaxID=150966 RepID=A0AAD3RY98_NEPGR|nr:hypothetical protein Nepgr_002445 [Nepenthes gracilis]